MTLLQLAEPDKQQLGPGEIRDSNRITLILALRQHGYSVLDLGIVPDDPMKLKDAVLSGCEKGRQIKD